MLGLETIGLDPAQGEVLPLAAYREDFRARQWTIDGQDSWKLERQQEFKEPGFPSWEAFSRGDWETAMRLVEDERDWLREFAQENDERGISLFRVRVVEEPLAPYLQWELHLLRLRAEYGERIRVVGPERIRGLEADGPLPELLTLGNRTVYKIRYDDQGILDGAVRFVDPRVTARCRDFTRDLYEFGEDVIPYFDREVAHLPAPGPG
ncbi:DUF6879 family protein [Streptomyces sp. P1-3]|uniref:DUF6879 family protein n=1 Tax=Streptomyces sp. P1-3 TaxID=3421658 RepID=UPI003D35DD6C